MPSATDPWSSDQPRYKTVTGFAEWMLELYYSFLNCGYRIPVSAGSASGVMSSWIGYERVYVKLSAPFSYEQWFRDLKNGRSIATNGPLLEVEVNGKPPGTEFPWTKPIDVELKNDIHSQEPVERVEIVFNGKVVGNRASKTVRIPEPGWLAVRCFGPAGETIRYAHSSPFYFSSQGKLPVHRATPSAGPTTSTSWPRRRTRPITRRARRTRKRRSHS